MQIIFGDHVEKVRDRFIVLELDTFRIEGTDQRIQTWCALENVPPEDLAIVEHLKKLHQDLVDQYRLKNWRFCQQALGHLFGRWNGELDSFYQDLRSRVETLISNPPAEGWTADLTKNIA